MKYVKIKSDFITLGQFLKLADLIGSGGEAKMFLSSCIVEVNGIQEQRRGRKLFPHDIVKVESEEFSLVKDES